MCLIGQNAVKELAGGEYNGYFYGFVHDMQVGKHPAVIGKYNAATGAIVYPPPKLDTISTMEGSSLAAISIAAWS
jgi:hypothetical protein